MKRVSTYETPEMAVFEIHSEGALCSSGSSGRDEAFVADSILPSATHSSEDLLDS